MNSSAPRATDPPGSEEASAAILRERLAELRALLVTSLRMTESVGEDQILEFAASSARGLGPWQWESSPRQA